MKCERCGDEGDPTRSFCPHCGKARLEVLRSIVIDTEADRVRGSLDLARMAGALDTPAEAEARNAQLASNFTHVR